MNPYVVVILAALLLEYGLGLAADLLNLRALRPEPPAGFGDVYDTDTYRRSQEYTRVRTRFGLVPATFDLVVLLVFWFAGGFDILDQTLRDLGFGPILTGLAFFAVLGLLKLLLGLPFRWYATFVIEERFGFNRTTRRVFWTDTVKGAVLAVVLGAPLLAAVLWFFERTGSLAWLYCWGFAATFVVVVQFVAPAWILPLFFKFKPLEESALREAVLAYARSVDFPLKEVFVIDGSRRSSKANAFFTGFGRNRRVALFDTLIEKHEVPELVGVVAHEIGHYKKKHIFQGLAISLVHMGVIFGVLSLVLSRAGLYEAFGMTESSVYAGFVFFGLLYAPVELVLSLVLQAISRRNEYAADRFAARTTGRFHDLVAALKKLAAANLANLTPHPLYVALHHSHPPMPERVAALEREWSEPAEA